MSYFTLVVLEWPEGLSPAGCCSLGDLLSRSSRMGVPLRDLLRLAPVLLGSASGPQFFPLQAFWIRCLVLGMREDSGRHCSQPHAPGGRTNDWFLPEHWRNGTIWDLVAQWGLLKTLRTSRKQLHNADFLSWLVAEIFLGAPEMDRSNRSVVTGNDCGRRCTRELFFVKNMTIKWKRTLKVNESLLLCDLFWGSSGFPRTF